MRYVIFSKNDNALLKIAAIGFGKGDEATRYGPTRRNFTLSTMLQREKEFITETELNAVRDF